MTRVYLADADPKERSALRLMLNDLKMEVVGEAADWAGALANAPATQFDMLVVEWDVLPPGLGAQAVEKLRAACVSTIVVVMISHLEVRQQAEISAGADAFISRSDAPDRVARRLRLAAGMMV